jgi:glutamate carboxypeptidase
MRLSTRMGRLFIICSVFLTSNLFVNSTLSAAELDPTEQAMVAFIDESNAEAMALLIELININSGSMNFAGVREVADILIPEFEALGFNAYWQDGTEWDRAGHLIAEHRGSGNGPKLLLIGHLDTVFEADSPFQVYEDLGGGIARGPGISDMKGGDIIMLQALRALESIGELASMDVTVIMTGDEELSGRPLSLSKGDLIEAAKYADIALGFENGDGNWETANISRRSCSGWTLEVTGKPAHSSQVFREDIGSGAIYEAARILMSFYTELRKEELLTFNPGRIMGGTTVNHDAANNSGTTFGKNNVVAESTIVTGDIRAISPEQLQRVQQTIQALISEKLPHTSATFNFGDGYPPMAPTDGNRHLLAIYSQASQDLGLGVVRAVNPLMAGAADVSFSAEHVDMAIDGLGMSGSAGHTVEETGILIALPQQAKRAALLMYRLQQDR